MAAGFLGNALRRSSLAGGRMKKSIAFPSPMVISTNTTRGPASSPSPLPLPLSCVTRSFSSQTSSKYIDQKVTLNSGRSIPQYGFGTWRAEPGVVGRSVVEAVKSGYRHIDCAKVYRNQCEVGEALDGVFPTLPKGRDDLFITSKLWTVDMHPDLVEQACIETIKDLKCGGFLDLYLIHWPVAWENTGKWECDDDYYPKSANGMAREIDVPLADTWAALERLVHKGLVRDIGVCNAREDHLDEILDNCAIKPVLNQVELHPMWPQTDMKAFCAKEDIRISAYSPLASPNQYTPPGEKGLTEHSVIVSLADEVGVTPAALLLSWNLQKGHVVLTKSTTPSRIQANADLEVEVLSGDLVRRIDEIAREHGDGKGKRCLNPDWFYASGEKFFRDG